jgi:hypothetical protein
MAAFPATETQAGQDPGGHVLDWRVMQRLGSRRRYVTVMRQPCALPAYAVLSTVFPAPPFLYSGFTNGSETMLVLASVYFQATNRPL